MKIITVLGAIAVAVLFFFSVIFAIASSVDQTGTRLLTSLLLFIVGVVIIAGITTLLASRKPSFNVGSLRADESRLD